MSSWGTRGSVESPRQRSGTALTSRRVLTRIFLAGTWLAAAWLIFLPLIKMAIDVILSRLSLH